MSITSMRPRLACLFVMCTFAATARALINPNFTPIHLTEQSHTILAAKVPAGKIADTAELEVTSALKGKAPKKLTIDLTKAPKQHGEAARKQLAAESGRLALLFVGKYEDKELGYLHVGGTWMRLSGGGEKWEFHLIDDQLPATWAGGTDMLARCVKYVLASGPQAVVPVDSGTAWRSFVKVGAVKGKVADVTAVDLLGDGKLCVHVAAAGGDGLFRPIAGKEGFEDITAKVKLAARSAASAWGDFDGDGRLDLASFDGKALTVWKQAADGTFTPARPGKVLSATAGLAAISPGKGRPCGLLAGGPTPVILLNATKASALSTVPLALPAERSKLAKLGKPQPPLVADFTNDGIADILQPFETGGLLFAGKGGWRFEAGKPCGVHCTEGGGRAAVGDFDADGWLDVLTAGGEGVRIFHNLRDGTFAETLALSGEISYKAQPFASFCGVCDFNNDSRRDVFITYESQSPLLYFNRGFRSFGEAPMLELALAEGIGALDAGQQAAAFADLDGDGGQDFVLALSNGQVFCAYNDFGGPDALCIKARLSGASALPSPITVTAWEKDRCLGALPVRAGAAAAFFGIREAGAYTLKVQLPGRTWREYRVTVEGAPVEVLLERGGKPAATQPGR